MPRKWPGKIFKYKNLTIQLTSLLSKCYVHSLSECIVIANSKYIAIANDKLKEIDRFVVVKLKVQYNITNF
jgi:hypothetical protein